MCVCVCDCGCLQRPEALDSLGLESGGKDSCELLAGGCCEQSSDPSEEQRVPTSHLSRLFSSFFPLKEVVCPTGKVSFFLFHGKPVGPPVCADAMWLVYERRSFTCVTAD